MSIDPPDPRPAEESPAAIAGRILDGERVDWDAVASPSDPDASRLLEHLRALEDLADFHRSVQRSAPGRAEDWELQSWGELQIIEPIGSGSFGTVYHAQDPRLDREVALKILRPGPGGPASTEAAAATTVRGEEPTEVSPRTATRAIAEARLLARVQHPNVVTVYGADERDGAIGIWMELIEGETLASLVRRRGPFGASEAMAIGNDLLSALSAVHGAGILHRDIKAQNVMRAVGGRIVLMDFGLGKDLRRADEGDWAMGAALYAAPERLKGGEASVASDLYSLGALLYYLVTGRFPFEASTLAELLEAHDRGARTYLRDRRPDLPGPLVEVIERALRARPADRYQSAGQMDAALREAGKALRIPLARAPRWTPRVPHAVRVSRRRVLRLLAWVLPLPVLVGLGIWAGTLGRYSVQASLCRTLPHGGQASLAPSDAIGPNDRLFLDFKASRALYLYVVERDDRGSLELRFPSPRQLEQNPLSSSRTHRLPDLVRGADLDWTEAGAGERRQLLFIASPRPIPEWESAARDSGRPGFALAVAPILDREAGRHVPGSREEGASPERVAEAIFAHALPLRSQDAALRGPWIRCIALDRAPQSYRPIESE